MIDKIYNSDYAATCFFRTAACPPNYKVLLQITEKCNFKCSHCFVESTATGNEMSLQNINEKVIPNLIKSNVTKVTLTGGEPLVHKDINNIVSVLCENDIEVSLCTNGSLITDDLLRCISSYSNVHFNISLDGLRFESHGKFRGNLNRSTFETVIKNIRTVGGIGLLNGILTTPNRYASINEYKELCDFACEIGAKYILMNPLSPFGRGQESQHLAYSREEMIALKKQTLHKSSDEFEVVYIRFPNENRLQLGGCPLGSFPYVFTNGDVVICPYAAFASENEDNEYRKEQFHLYNIMNDDTTIQEALETYTLPNEIGISQVQSGKGCCAAKVANNQPLESIDNLN